MDFILVNLLICFTISFVMTSHSSLSNDSTRQELQIVNYIFKILIHLNTINSDLNNDRKKKHEMIQLPDKSCRNCGDSLQIFLKCKECQIVEQEICFKCNKKTGIRYHLSQDFLVKKKYYQPPIIPIKLFLSFISNFNLNIFIYYRIILGTFILLKFLSI